MNVQEECVDVTDVATLTCSCCPGYGTPCVRYVGRSAVLWCRTQPCRPHPLLHHHTWWCSLLHHPPLKAKASPFSACAETETKHWQLERERGKTEGKTTVRDEEKKSECFMIPFIKMEDMCVCAGWQIFAIKLQGATERLTLYTGWCPIITFITHLWEILDSDWSITASSGLIFPNIHSRPWQCCLSEHSSGWLNLALLSRLSYHTAPFHITHTLSFHTKILTVLTMTSEDFSIITILL